MADEHAPAGWYTTQAGRFRWWDGTAWTDRFQDEEFDVRQESSGQASEPDKGAPRELRHAGAVESRAIHDVRARGEEKERHTVARRSGFHFDGGAATYWGTTILAVLITVLTLSVCYPFALVLRERWRAKHTYLDGHRLVFTGTGLGLFGLWLKWLLLIIITLTIYTFWVAPRVQKWKVEHTDFDPTWEGAKFERAAA
jgi:hypothetical protein